MTFFRVIVCIVLMVVVPGHALFAQEKDSATLDNILNGKLTKELLGAVSRKPPSERQLKNVKSEDVFLPYEGKIIRNITIRHIGFERTMHDTTRSIRNRITKIADALHVDTREQVIRNNLFFRKNRPLNPYRLADNERYLRDLDFILDSKIVIHPVKGSTDSVDVEVMARDIFSLGGRLKLNGINGFSGALYDANLLGMGQRLQGEMIFNRERDPRVGYALLFTRSSIKGSLVNLSLGVTQLNNGISAGEENEFAYYFRLDRPLVSPYSRMAGGVEISHNWSKNVYNTPDSLFRNYRYNVNDLWVGYNIGIKNNLTNRSRHFIAWRYYRQNFNRQPFQEAEQQRRIYNDQQFVLGEFTFYNLNFYKTSYVYGFGRTEDVPYGQTINVTAGWAEESGLRRAYLGTYAIKRVVRPSGRFYDFEAGAGAFFNEDVTEDGTLYVNATYYSKMYEIKKSKIRHQFNAGYARAFNNRVRDLITLNDDLRGFQPDSLFGFQRMVLRSETTVFMPGHLLGFRFAPFVSLEGGYLRQKQKEPEPKELFFGTTGGIRIRNENLIFGTIEFRVFYYPTTVPGIDPLSFKVTTNLRLKYSGSFVRPPDFVRYN